LASMLKGVREVGGAGAANCARVRLQPHDARKGENSRATRAGSYRRGDRDDNRAPQLSEG
jgi:hypothetical protein